MTKLYFLYILGWPKICSGFSVTSYRKYLVSVHGYWFTAPKTLGTS